MRLLWIPTAALLLATSIPSQEDEQTAQAVPNPMRVALEEDTARETYAVHDGGEVTWGDITALMGRRSNFRQPIPWQPGEVADDLARQVALLRLMRDAMVASAEAEGWVNEAAATEAVRDVKLWHMVYEQALADITVASEEVRLHYDDNPEEFALPFEFHMRHLFLSCYEEVEVQEGDTPTAIAERVSGDPAAALDIRDSSSRRLLDGWDHPVEEIDALARPLRPGEALLVPMDPEARAQVRAHLEEIAAGIHSEEDLIAAAQQWSDGDPAHRGEEIGPLPQGGREFLPELLEAGQTLPLGEISDIIETKHGFQIVMITQRQMDERRPFEEVSASIERNIDRSRRTEAFFHWMENLVAASGTAVEIPEGLDLSERQTGDPETVLAILPDGSTLTLAEIWEHLGGLPPNARLFWMQHPRECVISHILLRASDILDRAFEEADLGDWADTLVEMQMLSQWVAPAILRMAEVRAEAEATEDVVRAHFEENIESYRRSAELTVRQITVRPNPASGEAGQLQAERDLAAALVDVDTPGEFLEVTLAMTSEILADEASPESLGLYENVPLDRFSRQMAEEFAGAQPGDIIGPRTLNRAVMAWMVLDRTDYDLPTFEEVAERVRADVVQTRRQALPLEMRDAVLAEAHFELVRPEPEEENPGL